MRKKRLLWQLYPSYLLITLLALLAVSVDALWYLQQTYREQTQRDLAARARLVSRLIAQPLAEHNYHRVDTVCKEIGLETATRVTIILPSGQVVADSEELPQTMDNHQRRPEVKQAQATGLGVATRFSHTQQQEMMYVAVPYRDGGALTAIVRTALPLTMVEHAVSVITMKIVLGMLIIAVLAALISLLVARRISRPLEDMTTIASRYAQGDLSLRLSPQGTREMAALADAMHHMATELDDRIRTTIRQRNEQEAMLLSMTEGILAVDQHERILKMNLAAGRLLKVNPTAAQGRDLQETVRNSDLQQFISRVLAGTDVMEAEIHLGTHREQCIHLSGTMLSDEDGHRIGALVVMNDITRLRRLETVRQDFVANVSHELKTPITSIKGFVETLVDGSVEDPQDAQRFLGIIAKHTNRLEAIIDDLLCLSRLEQSADPSGLSLVDTPLHEVLSAALHNCARPAQAKEIGLHLLCAPELRAPINAPLLEQAVTNLVDNAIKYSEAGHDVQLEAVHEGDELAIHVRDHGCGIPPEHLPRLFERFYRVDTGRSRKLGGTGLGLAIVKHIAQAHAGRVAVHSLPGQGSTFSIYVPLSRITAFA